MNKTSIEWCDLTWNPIRASLKGASRKARSGTFCTRISPGCTHCYASTINKRFGNGLEYTVPNLEKIEFFLDERILAQPLHEKKPRRIFVGDMFDLFHEAIPDDLIGEVFAVMALCPQHTFQVLTKRAERMCAILTDAADTAPQRYRGLLPLPHVWLGVSVEDKQRAKERIPFLQATPARVRFLSVEPQLEIVAPDLRELHWVICGGESGPGARPFNLAWAESLLMQCRAAGVPFFMKQVGSNPWMPNDLWHGLACPTINDRKGGDHAEWPAALRVREFPSQKAEAVLA
jgi:protein gp37